MEQIALIGLNFLDTTIKWPLCAETELLDRNGWERKYIDLSCSYGKENVEAMIKREFAVHKMVKSEGFTTSIASTGLRLHYGGRVFANSNDAMELVEKLQLLHNNFEEVYNKRPRNILNIFGELMKKAEREGKILKNITYCCSE